MRALCGGWAAAQGDVGTLHTGGGREDPQAHKVAVDPAAEAEPEAGFKRCGPDQHDEHRHRKGG
jgi:hypothetical protein